MLWEYLLNIPIYPAAPLVTLMLLDIIPWTLFVAVLCFFIYSAWKMKPWRTVINSKGGTLGIFVDYGNRAHFVNMKNKDQFGVLKDWGFYSINRKGLYKASAQNVNIGIWASRIIVPAPVHLCPAFQTTKRPDESLVESMEDKYGVNIPPLKQRYVPSKARKKSRFGLGKVFRRGGDSDTLDFDVQPAMVPVEQKKVRDQARMMSDTFSDNPMTIDAEARYATTFYQFIVDEWEKWFPMTLSPLLYRAQVEDKARSYADIQKSDTPRQKINLKLIAIAAIVIIGMIFGLSFLFG